MNKRHLLLMSVMSIILVICMCFAACDPYEEPVLGTKLDAPVVSIDANGLASWTAVENASGYKYTINGGSAYSTNALSVQLYAGQTIKVKAVGDGKNYLDSDYSQPSSYTPSVKTQLDAPVVSIDANGLASWSAVANASGYAYKLNNGAETAINGLSLQLSDGDTLIVKAVGDNIDYTDSAFSSPKTYTAPVVSNPITLDAPVISVDENGHASWSAMANASAYAYKLNNGETVTIHTTSLQLNDGDTLVVKALGDGENYLDSAWSTPATYTAPVVVEPSTLDAPVVSVDANGLATWAAVENASGYAYKLNNGEAVSTNALSLQLNDGDALVVKALGDGENYLDSAWSTPATYTAPAVDPATLDTPVVSVDANGLASWAAVENASCYAYKLNNGDVATTNALSIQLSDGDTIVVKALGDGENYLDSDWSNTHTYTATIVDPTALDAPVVSIDANGLATWAAVENASGYAYKLNDGDIDSTVELSVQLADGDTIVVMALGNGTTHLDSAWSTPATYTVATCEHTTLKWESDNAQHWQVCADCGVQVGEKANHNWNDTTEKCDDCAKPAFSLELVNSVDDLKDGMTIIIVGNKDGAQYALSTTQNSNNRAAASFDGALTDGIQLITLIKIDETTWALKVDGGYLYAAGGSSNNYLKTENTLSIGKWKITFDGDAANIVGPSDVARNIMRFNPTTSERVPNPLFSCYASGQLDIYIYALTCIHHFEETIPAVEATCSIEGWSEGARCKVCGEITTAPTSLGYNKSNHKNTKTINAVAPSCYQAGYEGDTYCNDCEKTVATGNAIAATGKHNWATSSYSHDDEGHWHACQTEGCTAQNDYSAHTPCTDEHENGWYIDVEENGHYRLCEECCEYYAIAKHAAKDADEWKCDKNSHWQECECGERVNYEPHKWKDNTSKPASAGCVWQSCVCGAEQEVSICEHNETETKYDATHHWTECSNCGTQLSEKVEHTFGEYTYKFDDEYELCEATHTCSGCLRSEEFYTENITKVSTPATCNSYATTKYTAHFDEEGVDDYTRTITGTSYAEHTPKYEYSSLEHWQECTVCKNQIGEKGDHTLGECVCGKLYTGHKVTSFKDVTAAIDASNAGSFAIIGKVTDIKGSQYTITNENGNTFVVYNISEKHDKAVAVDDVIVVYGPAIIYNNSTYELKDVELLQLNAEVLVTPNDLSQRLAQAEAQAVFAEIEIPAQVTANFKLPITVVWSVETNDALSISVSNNEQTANITRGENDVDVTLTATYTASNGVECTQTYTVKVLKEGAVVIETETITADYLNNKTTGWTCSSSDKYTNDWIKLSKNNENVTSPTFEAQPNTSVVVTMTLYLNNTGSGSSKILFELLDEDNQVISQGYSEELNELGTGVSNAKTITITLDGASDVNTVKATFIKNSGGNIGFSKITVTYTKPVNCAHEWSGWTCSATDTAKHEHTCAVCEKVEAEKHTYENGVCTVCGAEKPAAPAREPGYYLVTSVDELEEGDKIIIVAAGSDYAMSTEQKNINRGAVAVTRITKDNNNNDINMVTFTTTVQEITLGKDGSNWTFYTGSSGYLYASSSTANQLKTQTTNNENGQWEIKINSDGTASIIAQGTNTRNIIRYNYNNGTPLFACYGSASQAAIQIYKYYAA